MEEYGIDSLPASESSRKSISFTPFGTPVETAEVESRLSENLYRQLSEGRDDFVLEAVRRAEVYIGTILSWLKVRFDLDDSIVREIVLMQTLYELHMALGHEEAGREYRKQMKDTVIAAYGSYPDSDNSKGVQAAPSGAIAVPKANPRMGRLNRARGF